MTDFFRDLYQDLLSRIENCTHSSEDAKEHIECCFHAAKKLLLELDKKFSKTEFATPEEEIQFFKKVKPKFASFVEFYSLLYKVALFAPEPGKELKEFYDLEQQRAEQFLMKNEELRNYIHGNSTEKDREYFLRANKNDEHTLHDELVAQILAREEYIKYLKEKSSKI